MPLGRNQVLGDSKKSAESRPHRVAIANWPVSMRDPRSETFESLARFIRSSGYEGTEFGPAIYSRYFAGDAPRVAARKARKILNDHGLANFGSTLHVNDEIMRRLSWIDLYTEQVEAIRELGSEFVSYQISIHPDYEKTGGLYREDEKYLQWCARNIADLREMAWAHNMNFYLEVHVDRITEDPAACCRLLDLAACELNGDMSHYLSRGFIRGRHVERVLKHVNHTHVRMARMYGDLSAVVENPRADWAAKGVTWQMFQFMMPALAGGLSSRTIAGETGPMHLVKDTMTQDAALVPLYRAMARYADASAQGMVMKVESPDDLKPWGA